MPLTEQQTCLVAAIDRDVTHLMAHGEGDAELLKQASSNRARVNAR